MHAARHLNKAYFLKVDIKDFYSNISNKQVYEVLIEKGFSPKVAGCITRLCTYKNGLPQGSPCSGILANLVFQKTSDRLSTLARQHKITFTTFLDDVVFSSDRKFRWLIHSIISIIRLGYFHTDVKKISYRSRSCEITGIIVCGKDLLVPREVLEKAKYDTDVRRYVRQIQEFCIAKNV